MYDEVIAVFFFFKQKTAYEMRISDWSSDVCSSDLGRLLLRAIARVKPVEIDFEFGRRLPLDRRVRLRTFEIAIFIEPASDVLRRIARQVERRRRGGTADGGIEVRPVIVGAAPRNIQQSADLADRKGDMEGKRVSCTVGYG